ncbi:glycerophosphodiester phosphodiesterase family protein [Paramicrobacterium chengjingii]|uniref:Glycerophosphodiester phosphodiesterase n=1 Tax=Paramicrobacterium chengjingii TaxID=2769067 RepID=A0ABX6YMD9_9MICO|nr:glycerophosphodiester phosphodiesterase family protein [Microbacterium chengjingii]QPZ39903.1 glycerophosphodiester phosphodiesterase [Microbacterium chengjingii]
MTVRFLAPQRNIRIFAHRGLAAGVPENTLAAFSAAVAAGADYVETDVHVTKDGVCVIHHDPTVTLDGTTWHIADERYDTLRALDLGEGESIPALSDALSAFPEVRFNIDVKARAAAEPAARVIRDADAVDRVLVTSFDEKTRRGVVGLLPGVTTSASSAKIIAALPWMLLGMPTRVATVLTGIPVVQIPEKRGKLRLVSPRIVRVMHRAGIEVHVWTVNDPADMARLHGWGVEGIITDRCDVAIRMTRH